MSMAAPLTVLKSELMPTLVSKVVDLLVAWQEMWLQPPQCRKDNYENGRPHEPQS